jgi:sec-independent protein translocase protein TatC
MIKKISAGDQGIPDGEGAEMSFFDHLEELRWHIVKSIIAILIFAVIVYIFESWVFENIIFAHKNEKFITYDIFQRLGIDFAPSDFQIIQTEMAEQFFTSLKVSFWIGFVVAFPYVFYQFWSFIKPGLYENEAKAAKGVVFVCSFLFTLGVAFGFIVLAPFAIKFLSGYSVGIAVENSTSLKSYVGYLTNFTIPTGIIFQMPLLVYFLAKVGLLTDAFMRTYRKHSLVIIFILAAMITPPDPMTMFLIGVPLYGLYEVSIFIARRTTKRREKELNS